MSGNAKYSISNLANGLHIVTAAYSGDSNNTASASGQFTQQVISSTSIALTSSINPSSLLQTVKFTATVNGTSPTGTVQFIVDGADAGVPLALGSGTASYETNSLATGTHTITASYSGDINNSPCLSSPLLQLVNPTVLHTFPAGLQMISAPVYDDSYTLSSIFSPSNVEIAAWIASTQNYVLNPNSPADTMHNGVGYWAKFSATTELFDAGAHTVSTTPFSIQLSAGWNLIGVPRLAPVPATDIAIVDSYGNTNTLPNAGSVVYGSLYTWQAGNSQYSVLSGNSFLLQPYAGYWIYAYSPCELIYMADLTDNLKLRIKHMHY
jgi:hypothetical protein